VKGWKMAKLIKKTIGDMFDRTVRKYPNKEALRWQDQGWTYVELQQSVNSLAKGLMKLGVKAGDKVAIWMPNYPEWIYTNLANAKIGAVTVPINIRFRTREIEYVLRHSGVSTIVMADQFLTNYFCNILYELCPEINRAEPGHLESKDFPALRNVICLKDMPGMLTFKDVMKEGSDQRLDRELNQRQSDVQPDQVVNMFYTSGTTGTPKAAMANHNILMNVANYNEWMKINEQDIVQIPSPLFYTTANYWCMLCPIMAGAKMCLATYFTLEEKLEQISKEKVTVTVGMAKMWIDMVNFLKEHPYDTSSLRIGWTGGAPITIGDLKAITSTIVPNIVNLYGMTETGGITTMTKIDDPLEVLVSTIGTPLPNFELKIVDKSTGETLPVGQPGELCVRGPYVIKEYFNMPKEEKAIYFDKDGWYHTQDILVQHDNGYYSFIGRIKDMIKVGGENVSLTELDEFLLGHNSVKMVATIGVPDISKGEVPLAFIESLEGDALTEREIIDYCKGKIASYKIPKYVRFIKDWPVSGGGKIQRFKLKELVKEEFQFEK
jgi:fatty-acyl-CoA synthase